MALEGNTVYREYIRGAYQYCRRAQPKGGTHEYQGYFPVYIPSKAMG